MKAGQNSSYPAAARIGLCLSVAWLCLAALLPCLADSVNPPLNIPTRPKQVFLPKTMAIEDYFPKKSMDYAVPEPVNLAAFRVPGLTYAAMKILGDNLFVVVDNTKFDTMADIYKDNRLRGKSNFVTLDAIIHPYLALRNAILAKVIEEHLAPD